MEPECNEDSAWGKQRGRRDAAGGQGGKMRRWKVEMWEQESAVWRTRANTKPEEEARLSRAGEVLSKVVFC